MQKNYEYNNESNGIEEKLKEGQEMYRISEGL